VIPFAVEARASVNHDDAQTAISILLAAYAAGPILASPFIGWIAGTASGYIKVRSHGNASNESVRRHDFTSGSDLAALLWKKFCRLCHCEITAGNKFCGGVDCGSACMLTD